MSVLIDVKNGDRIRTGTVEEMARRIGCRPNSLHAYLATGKTNNQKLVKLKVSLHTKQKPARGEVKDRSIKNDHKHFQFKKDGIYLNRYSNYVVCISADHTQNIYKFVAVYIKKDKFKLADPTNSLCVTVTDGSGCKENGPDKKFKLIYTVDLNTMNIEQTAQFLKIKEWVGKHREEKALPKVSAVKNIRAVQTVRAEDLTEMAVIQDRLKNIENYLEKIGRGLA